MAGDPRIQLGTIPLAIGMDNVNFDEVVQPVGQRPRLVESRNTRLSKVPGVVSKAPGCTQISPTGGLVDPCGGLIPIAGAESTLLVQPGRWGGSSTQTSKSKRVVGSASSPLDAVFGSDYQRDGYYPAQVTAAGVVSNIPGNFNAACCYVASTGYTYFAHLSGHLGQLEITVIADDGRVIIPSQTPAITMDATSTAQWIGLSAHGTTVLLWLTVAGNIRVGPISITSDLQLSLGSFSTAYTPNSLTWTSIALAYDPDDTANVYLACRDTTTANSITVSRVAVSTRTVAASTTHAVGGAWDNLSIAYLASSCLIMAVSRTSGVMNHYELNITSCALTWSAAGVLYQGITACGFHSDGGTGLLRVFAVSRTPGATPGLNNTYVLYRDSGGTLTFGATPALIKSMRIVGQMVTQKTVAGRFYCMLPMVNQWANTGSYTPTSANFVSEPAVELYRSGFQNAWHPVARLGTDLVMRYPGFNLSGEWLVTAGNSAIAVGNKVLVTYLAENIEEGKTTYGYVPRYAWLDFGNAQPRYALSDSGAALIAGALPAAWDGTQVTEHSPLRAPVVSVAASGGATGWTSGAYLIAAMIIWRDAQGIIHRSPPSNIVTISGVGLAPAITVFLPYSMQDTGDFGVTQPHPRVQVLLFASELNGVVLYAQSDTGIVDVAFTFGNAWIFSHIPQPVADAFHPAIYTDASATQELPNFCPNASIDVAIVSDRPWMIDAERRNRAWYGKPKTRAYFPEMNPDQYVDFPASVGELMAVVGFNDLPLFLSKSGIWTVAGEGPDALLQPPLFSSPQQLSDVSCTQTNSVVRAPNGIMFVSENRFAIFNGQVEIVNDIDATLYGNIVGCAVFRKQHEVCFFTAQGYVWVYNWQAAAFTLWDQTVTGVTSLTAVAQVPKTGKVLYYGDAGELWLMDPDSVSTTAQISLTTGWLLFGGPQDDNALGDMVLHAKRSGAHGLTITTSTDYDASAGNTVTHTYTAAEVLGNVTDTTTTKRYDLQPEVVKKHARSLRLVITETGAAGEAFQPVNISVEVIKEPGKAARGLYAGGRK